MSTTQQIAAPDRDPRHGDREPATHSSAPVPGPRPAGRGRRSSRHAGPDPRNNPGPFPTVTATTQHHVPWTVTLIHHHHHSASQSPWSRLFQCLHLRDSRRSSNASHDATDAFLPAHPIRLPNNLLFTVGFLEFFNALDFPANIWNQVPPPRFAVALMITCGIIIFCAMAIAAVDARRSWRNIQLLRRERAFLLRELADHDHDRDSEDGKQRRHLLAAWLSLNWRELGWEVFDRFGNDSVVGGAGVLVGIGTIMAVGGSNPKIFLASNLLSGWVGNSFMALYGVINAGWSVYLWARAYRHSVVVMQHLRQQGDEKMVRRAKKVFAGHQIYAVANGLNLLVSGAASLLSATFWWGYVMLLPCIAASIFCNAFWRRRVAYERVVFPFRPLPREELDLAARLRDSVESQERLAELRARGREQEVEKAFGEGGLASLMGWIVDYEMFPELAGAVAGNASVPKVERDKLGVRQDGEFTFTEGQVRDVPEAVLVPIGVRCAAEFAQVRTLYKERMSYELLGAYLCTPVDAEEETAQVEEEKTAPGSAGLSEKTASQTLGAGSSSGGETACAETEKEGLGEEDGGKGLGREVAGEVTSRRD